MKKGSTMSQRQPLPPHLEAFLHSLEEDEPFEQNEPFEQEEPEETIHVYVEEDRITFVRQSPETVESTPPPHASRSWLVVVLCAVLLAVIIVASLLAPSPTTSKAFTVTVQGFALAPVHQSVTVAAQATGAGVIAPTTAMGSVTFYNGQPYTQIISTGTILKGQDGIAVITDEAATIPPVSQTIPPTDGQVTVLAHALTPGTIGNIAAGDINEPCCVTSVIAQNPSAFTGGRGGQRFTYVTKQDVYRAVTPLLSTLERRVPQLFTSLALAPTCVPTVAAVPPVGQKAVTVNVTATVRCTAVSYDPSQVRRAIAAYSSHFGPGTWSNLASQVIVVSKNKQITLYVTGNWQPIVARRIWTGK
jgi:hypothetical protein